MAGNKPLICIKKLGKMAYTSAAGLQKEAAKIVLRNINLQNQAVQGYLFLVEHPPVYTVGLRNKQYICDENKLKALGADFVKTDRGGLITFHGPGQLVCYPVIYLGSFASKKSIKWYIRELENTIIDVCSHFGLRAYVTENVGVWINDRKVAAIGVHGSRFVTTHGVAINCNVDLKWFSHIVPCGIPNKEVTSLSQELCREVTVEESEPIFLDAFQKHFPCKISYES